METNVKRFLVWALALIFCFASLGVDARPTMSGVKQSSTVQGADSSNATVTVIAGVGTQQTRIFSFKVGVNNADDVTFKCGSTTLRVYEFGNTSGDSGSLWPFYWECAADGDALTGTAYTLDDDVTFTADADDTITLSATTGIVAGHPLVFETSASDLPDPLVAGTIYYYGTGTTKLYTTQADAVTDDGSTNVVDITDAGTGTHSLDGSYITGDSSTTFSTDFSADDTIVVNSVRSVVATTPGADSITIDTALTADSTSDASYYKGADDFNIIKGTAGTKLDYDFFYEQE